MGDVDPPMADATERLDRLSDELARAIAARDLAADGDERGDGHHHPAEVATDADQRERQLRELIRLKERQQRIELARRAIADGVYGTCSDCGADIPEGRLEAVPEATRCVRCQEVARRKGIL